MTQAARMEESNKSLMEAIIRDSITGILTIDHTGIIQSFNPAAERIFLYKAEEIIGQNISILVPQPVRGHHDGYLKNFMKVRKSDIIGNIRELHAVRKNGQIFPVQLCVSAIDMEGGNLMFSGMIQDISERAEQKQRLDFLQSLIIRSGETSGQDDLLKTVLGIVCRYIKWPLGHAYLWDEAAQVLKSSRCWYLEEGKDYSDFIKVSEEMAFPPGVGLPGRIRASGKPLWIVDIAKDPNYPRFTKLSNVNLHATFGAPVLVEGKTRVVLEFFCPTVMREDEWLLQMWDAVGSQLSRLIERNDAQEERVRYTKELEIARDEATRANQMKSEFLANMSHEIRTPLNGVIGAADLMRKTIVSKDQEKYLKVITGSGDTLLSLINDILDLSKIEAGEMTINPEPMVMSDFIRGVMQSMAARAGVKGIELAVRYDGHIPRTVMADGVRLNQIMINLMGNAVKFVEKGYIAVRIDGRDAENGKVALRIEVQDSGIGIPADKLGIIFDKFSQADATTTKKYGGTGLGLAITKRLIEMMGGFIGVQSRVGVGTTFFFEITVPVVEDAAPEDTEDLAGLKVLVVDDLEVSRNALSSSLERLKLAHDAAADGAAGLALMRQAAADGKPFSTVLVDRDMFAMAKTIRDDAALKDAKLILTTILGQPEDAGAEIFDDTLLKPADPHDLLQKFFEVIHPESARAAESASAPEGMSALNVHILLVENETVNQMVATDLLEGMGCAVEIAQNGKEAVDMVEQAQGKYAVVLMDCMMPVMDGYEATREIRRREKEGNRAHQAIVAMTANAMSQEKDMCLKAGMDDYLSKPVKERTLYDKLREYIPAGTGRSL